MRPTPRLIVLLALWLAFSIGAAFMAVLINIWVGFGAVILITVALEASVLRRRSTPGCSF